MELAITQIADYRVTPVGKLNGQPLHFAAKHPRFAVYGFCQSHPLASRPHTSCVTDFGLNLDDVRQDAYSLYIWCYLADLFSPSVGIVRLLLDFLVAIFIRWQRSTTVVCE
jgi:hypothetical protein